jgi:hypothetical protein
MDMSPQQNGADPPADAQPHHDIQQTSTEEIQKETESTHDIQDHRATYTDTPIRPVEKRKVQPQLH